MEWLDGSPGGGDLRYLHPLSDPEQTTRGKVEGISVAHLQLTSGGFEYGDFTIFQTPVQGLHKLQLDLVRSKRMMEILQLQLQVQLRVHVHGGASGQAQGCFHRSARVGKSREIKIKRCCVEPVRLQEKHAPVWCNPQGRKCWKC